MHQLSWTLLHCVGIRSGFTPNKYKCCPLGPPKRSGYCRIVLQVCTRPKGGYEGLDGALVGKGQGGRRQRSDKGVKLRPKYMGPNGETYTGRGPTPKWLRSLERKGEKREKFLVK